VTWEVRLGDCLDVLPTLAEGSVDAVVTDPPYGLEFMGKEWDRIDGSNGFRRAENPADVGRDSVFGRTSRTGPEYIAGHKAQLWHEGWAREVHRVLKPGAYLLAFGGTRTYHRLACAVEDAGFRLQDCLSWLYGQGFPKGKTQLKPAWEPILLAYKPGKRTLNVDECRIAATDHPGLHRSYSGDVGEAWRRPYQDGRAPEYRETPAGRWPANVVLDEEAAALLDEQSGTLVSGTAVGGLHRNGNKPGHVYWEFGKHEALGDVCYGDTGGASRFFYTAKADSGERHYAGRNTHPTVKPVDLMRWLCRLVTPKGGLILDPFMGSGSTGVAALAEGSRFLGIEREAEYVEIARRRIAGPLFAESR
jgi:site-specific DNA-methyltransferase (adenine-specific)